MSFANLRISAKFPLVIVTVSLLTGLATGITAHTKFSMQLELFAKDQLVDEIASLLGRMAGYICDARFAEFNRVRDNALLSKFFRSAKLDGMARARA